MHSIMNTNYFPYFRSSFFLSLSLILSLSCLIHKPYLICGRLQQIKPYSPMFAMHIYEQYTCDLDLIIIEMIPPIIIHYVYILWIVCTKHEYHLSKHNLYYYYMFYTTNNKKYPSSVGEQRYLITQLDSAFVYN